MLRIVPPRVGVAVVPRLRLVRIRAVRTELVEACVCPAVSISLG